MGTYIFYISIIALFIYSWKIACDKDKHYSWFKTLKPGDRIKVRVYSINCDCVAKATVTKATHIKHVEAKLDDPDYNRCKDCALINGITNKGEETCWYNATAFNKHNVARIDK